LISASEAKWHRRRARAEEARLARGWQARGVNLDGD